MKGCIFVEVLLPNPKLSTYVQDSLGKMQIFSLRH